MSRAIRLLTTAALAAALLPACRSAPEYVADLPAACPPATPEVQIVERRVYVPIPADLTRTEEVAEGPLAECPMVAAERRAALERANARLRAVAGKQGTEVEP